MGTVISGRELLKITFKIQFIISQNLAEKAIKPGLEHWNFWRSEDPLGGVLCGLGDYYECSSSLLQLVLFLFACIWIEEQSMDTNLQKGTKRAERRKKREPSDRQVHLASRRVGIRPPNVLVCQALKEKIKLARERSSRITE
uniref:Uncharacterized protein n=1 Tax=Solanum tuberosum TaxID=4113 RepID=M1CTW6_SOLTU